MARRVAIIGTGQTKYVTKRRDVSFPELAHEAARKALDDAGLTLNDVDAVVFGSGPDAFEGVNCPDKWSAGAVGALNKPFMRFHTGGATGGSTASAAGRTDSGGFASTGRPRISSTTPIGGRANRSSGSGPTTPTPNATTSAPRRNSTTSTAWPTRA